MENEQEKDAVPKRLVVMTIVLDPDAEPPIVSYSLNHPTLFWILQAMIDETGRTLDEQRRQAIIQNMRQQMEAQKIADQVRGGKIIL
jgi:hypothetical protein